MRTVDQIKERRFATTSRILTGKPLEARIVNDPKQGAAWTDCHTTIFMNEALPKASNEREQLVYDRGKLYHEIDHCEFHGEEVFRYYNKLIRSAKDPETMKNLGNALLDGHGEFHGGKKWQGQVPYIMATLHALVDVNNPSVFSGLLLFVRLKKWRNAKEAAYWQPYEARILEAITCKSAMRTLDIALEISNALADAKPKQPEYGKGKPEKSEEKSEEQSESEESESEQGESQDDNEPPDDDESNESEDSDESQDESEESEESESDESNESEESDSTPETPVESSEEENGQSDTPKEENEPSDPVEAQNEASSDESEDESDLDDEYEMEDETEREKSTGESDKLLDSDVEREIDEKVQSALDECERETATELADIMQEYVEQEPEQQFLPNEEPVANEMSEVLRSILVERNRVVWTPAKRSGRLNTHRLTNVVTGGTFLQQRSRVEGMPKVALLLDCSSSIEDCEFAEPLSAAARVLNGALWKAGIESLTLTFKGNVDIGNPYKADGSVNIIATIETHKFLPPTKLNCDGTTPTHAAMEKALDWLSDASKSLMVIVTDGQPDSVKEVEKQYAKAVCANCYVVLVTIGNDKIKGTNVCDERKAIANVSDLPRVLEPTLTAFARG